MTNHPDQRRLAELLVDRGGGETRRGSGYLVSPGWVITADHNVADAKTVRVWSGAPARLDASAGVVVSPEQVLRVPGADLALVPVGTQGAVEGTVGLGRLDRGPGGSTPVVAAGFPRFKLREAPDEPAVRLREVHYATGSIAVGSNVKTDTFEFRLEIAPADADPNRSPWAGMSGAAVFAAGRLIGVVGQHYPTESAAVLTVRPLTSLFDSDLDAIEPWLRALPQLKESGDELMVASTPSARDLSVRRAQRAAAVLCPPVLVAREEQLALLQSLVRGEHRFMWLQGRAFAGKTALLAWFALHQPSDVDVAACFLRRTTRAADAQYALDVLCQQLAVHAGRSARDSRNFGELREEFFDLLDEAAAASADGGHRLLLLIDGLDEYQADDTGLGVSGWLPDEQTLPDATWLLAASRTGVNINRLESHPLSRNIVVIDSSAAAKEIERLAANELEQARKNAGGLLYEMLGLLTAAASGLSCRELTELLQHHGRPLAAQISDILDRDLSRSILQILDPHGDDRTVYVFAHDTLLTTAEELFGADLPYLRRRLIEWADSYAGNGWPADTPTYLLLGYPQLLKELNDADRPATSGQRTRA